MSTKQYCRECNQPLAKGSASCSCGWRGGQATVADHRCHYQSMGRRCPLPGTICPYPYGSSPWYCSGHWRCMDDPRLGEAVTLDAEENYEKILESRRSWRDKLFETGGK